jgi:hypothetical protein
MCRYSDIIDNMTLYLIYFYLFSHAVSCLDSIASTDGMNWKGYGRVLQ